MVHFPSNTEFHLTSAGLNIDISKKFIEYFRNGFWRAFERTFQFLAATSRSQVTRGVLNNPSPHQVVENPEADQGTG